MTRPSTHTHNLRCNTSEINVGKNDALRSQARRLLNLGPLTPLGDGTWGEGFFTLNFEINSTTDEAVEKLHETFLLLSDAMPELRGYAIYDASVGHLKDFGLPPEVEVESNVTLSADAD